MVGSFVVRLLDPEDALLAWASVCAVSRPQDGRASCPFVATTITKFVIEESGTVAKLVVHWTDLDIARVREMPPIDVLAGQVFDFDWVEPVWLIAGMRDVVLPPVTVRAPVTVQPLVGALAGKDPRT